MAIVEDAASVLDQFLHDVANLPAEIAHLMEEMQAKEEVIQENRNIISHRDGNIQKFIKHSGSLVKNPKEESYGTAILAAYEKAEALQQEKCLHAEKAASLLDRQVKRLDMKIRDLQATDVMPFDASLPSLLRASSGNIVPPSTSTTNTGANTPLQPLSVNTAGGSMNIANQAIARIQSAALAGRALPGAAPHPLMQAATIAHAQARNREREGSVGSNAESIKRRRLNSSLGNQSLGTLPPASSSLARQASLGPGTPRAGTPGGAANASANSRAGSAGPQRMPKKAPTATTPSAGAHVKKFPPNQQHLRKKAASRSSSTTKKASAARRLLDSSRASPSTTISSAASLSGSSRSPSADPQSASHHHPHGRAHGPPGAQRDGPDDDPDIDMDGEGDGEDENDETRYCTCQRVSFGDMIACDNAECKLQWFHWGCVGLKEEPVGEWLCPDCKRLPRKMIRKV